MDSRNYKTATLGLRGGRFLVTRKHQNHDDFFVLCFLYFFVATTNSVRPDNASNLEPGFPLDFTFDSYQKLTCLEANVSTSVNNPFSKCICSEAKLAACGSCVTSMIVFFNSWLRVESICSISSPERASRFPVGSSARIRSGSVTIARAIATRCSWPPDS